MLGVLWTTLLAMLQVTSGAAANEAAGKLIRFNDDGGWCWFQDERVIVHDGKIILGTIAAGKTDASRKGDVEVCSYDIKTGKSTRFELHDRLQHDDHNSPVFLARPDGRILTLYAKHGPEDRFYYRISEPNDPAQWGAERTFTPSVKTRLTYSNLYRLQAEGGRIYDFFRGLDGLWKPSYAFSDDGGETWTTGSILIQSSAARPYVRYASDGIDAIHLLYTEGHPRDFDNSVYHIYYRGGNLCRSDGSVIRGLKEGLKGPDEGTRIFQGDPNHVAWATDIELDERGYPYVAYSVQIGSAGLPVGRGGEDHRYRYARWDGSKWLDAQLAYAGRRLYPGEDDYTGLVALHPHNPDVVYISTDADPAAGEALISKADAKRHYEIFKGITRDSGRTWQWTPVTRNSTVDNLRPIVPKWDSGNTALLWLRGTLRSYTDYDLDVVGLVMNGKAGAEAGAVSTF
jgi:hypothetical protein